MLNFMKYIGCFSLFVLLFSCQEQEANSSRPQEQIRTFPVVTVDKRTVNTATKYPAELSSSNSAQIRPKVSGFITNVYVEEGQRVRKGQRLFKIETDVLSQNAQSAKAQITSSEANVQTLQVEVDRLKPLVEKGIISDVQLQTAQAKMSQAQAQLDQSRANYRGIIANINFSNVTSPIEGVIGKLNYRSGSLVSPQDMMPITTVSNTGDIQAYFSLNEKQYISFFRDTEGKNLDEKIASLPKVKLELIDGSIYEKEGKIVTTTGQIDAATGTIRFRADFDNSDGMLSSGNSGTILVPKSYDDVAVIPESSTYEQQGIVYSYKVVSDSVINTPIKLISRVDNLAIIGSGLNAGDVIVAEGVAKLSNGMKIKKKEKTIEELTNIEPVQ